jgi:hypothetical protein
MKVRWIMSALTLLGAAFIGAAPSANAQEQINVSDVSYFGGADKGCDGCGAKSDCGCDASSKGDKGGKGGCDPCEPWRLFEERGGWSLTGWINGSGTYTGGRPASRYNGPQTFNDRDDLKVNQVYAVFERVAETDECGGWGWGGRVDVLYGSDYIFTQATGLETRRDGTRKWNSNEHYGIALPQAYAEIAVNDVSVKMGHFYTVIGNEVVTAPDNVFISHAYAMQYGEPFTHTGILATWDYSDNVDLIGGVTNGWDAFDPVSSRAAFLGGFTWTNDEGDLSLAAMMTMGDEYNSLGVFSNRTMYSLVVTANLTDDWTYILQHDNGWQDSDTALGVDAEWYGINQYLLYSINECWSAGGRFEWFRDDDGTRVAGPRPGNPANGPYVGHFYQSTMGLNWMPNANWTIRQEMRWDWFDGVGLPFDNNSNDDQFTYAIDAILLW